MKFCVLLLFALITVLPKVAAQQDGKLDSTFGYNGIYIDSTPVLGSVIPWKITIMQDDAIILLNNVDGGNELTRFTKNGLPDSIFCVNSNDTLTDSVFYKGTFADITQQNDGKLLLTACVNSFALARFQTNGQLDSSFNRTGIAITPFYVNSSITASGTIIQPDGRYLVYGNESATDIGMIRFNTNGTLDTAFCACGNGKVVIHTSVNIKPFKALITPENKILIAVGGYQFHTLQPRWHNGP